MKKCLVSFFVLCNVVYCETQTEVGDLFEALRDLTGRVEKLENENEQLSDKVKKLEDSFSKQMQEFKEKESNALIENLKGDAVVQKVVNLIEANDLDKARAIVELFVKKNPDDIYCGMLLFYCGNSYFIEKDYSNAAMQYMKSYEKNSKGSKSAECLYKLALCFKNLKELSKCKATLQKVISDYPGEYARKANGELRKID